MAVAKSDKMNISEQLPLKNLKKSSYRGSKEIALID